MYITLEGDPCEVKELSEEEKLEILAAFLATLVNNMEEMDPKFAEVLEENFWDLM